MNKESSWAVLECTKCNEIFSVPSVTISQDHKDFRHLICPCCGAEGTINKEITFISHFTMGCGIKEVTKWVIEEV